MAASSVLFWCRWLLRTCALLGRERDLECSSNSNCKSSAWFLLKNREAFLSAAFWHIQLYFAVLCFPYVNILLVLASKAADSALSCIQCTHVLKGTGLCCSLWTTNEIIISAPFVRLSWHGRKWNKDREGRQDGQRGTCPHLLPAMLASHVSNYLWLKGDWIRVCLLLITSSFASEVEPFHLQ